MNQIQRVICGIAVTAFLTMSSVGCFGVAPLYLATMALTSVGTTAAGTALANKVTEKKSEPTATPAPVATASNQPVKVTAKAESLKPKSATTEGAKAPAKPATLADARRAKKVQGLQGRMFQNSSSKDWFLEDPNGQTWKLRGDKFCKI